MAYLHEVTHANAVIIIDGMPKRMEVGAKVVRESNKPICGNRSKVLGACNADGKLLTVATPKRTTKAAK